MTKTAKKHTDFKNSYCMEIILEQMAGIMPVPLVKNTYAYRPFWHPEIPAA